ncbi:probable receptor-like serine/threonine-protein kinase At4g34500 [Olea europaea var. sylvestris]|uniref:non-specific serine/threonine protein kinase n=1 Tax=Olea europaea subsp. europaea TaxID=158383 RepID=A0A8S0VG38_OLEEU|nr:probable receptor-like serine/threonine-protein kinase At4g34500 [Olea europaea var. sylvestris]CAA3030869.1 probable receptor-like serine threonine- kinase At4g34500 [Olea europaea subsp. europaea]
MAVSGKSSGENQTSENSPSSFFAYRTPILGQKLYVVIIATAVIMLFIFFLIFLFLRWNRNSKRRRVGMKHSSGLLPLVRDEITEVKSSDHAQINTVGVKNKAFFIQTVVKGIVIESEGKKGSSESNESSTSRSESSSAMSASTDGLSNIGWGRWYSLKELEIATNQFSDDNVIGEGGYGIVYRGVLHDGSVVAVKNLLNNKGQAEKEFKVEVEAIGKVRHKNLVGLMGYCAEGAQRLLVYEYIDNGNLEQWLHGDVGTVSPLTWEIRMKIAIGTARGLAYLHEGLEPKVVHRDVKSSNILLDRKWNPKVSDFGLAKLLGSEKSHVTTRVMGTFGYVSPDYASTGMLNEGNDVYSFGVLLMEIITGRSPVDYSRPPGEMNLIEWFKGMVGSRRGEELVDPLIEIPPPPRTLKRVLLVCLRCIDLDASKRPKMGQIVHMLEADDFSYRVEPRSARETASLHPLANGNKGIGD